MRNIWQIFLRDARRIRNNVIALIVIMGIIVVPCLYAWFNIAASWDPYNNTDNLKVAVASVDEGYQGSLVPIEVNIGERVLTSLHENTPVSYTHLGDDPGFLPGDHRQLTGGGRPKMRDQRQRCGQGKPAAAEDQRHACLLYTSRCV